ncbi:MAG: WbuC family cupin fold metalloprotein [Chitinophagaceae bacterium]|nr:WbuC family cupin fold metalloprotein [Chitinophagaceae bacterium]
MTRIYSKQRTDKLLHILFSADDIKDGRTNIVEDDQFIQAAAMRLNKGTTFKPHKHLWKVGKHTVIAQESWVVIRGRVKCFLYDLDGVLLCEHVLNAGDISITLEGGHTYEILDNGTMIYEYKTGPYDGQEKDKVFI